MSSTAPFSPGNSTSLAVTATTGNVAMPAGTGPTIRICNDGTKTLFFKFGTTSVVTAATTDTPILAGATNLFTVGTDITYLAGIAGGSDSGTLRITRGFGDV